jgi:hypothetical protein
MAVFQSSEQLGHVLQTLFSRVAQDSEAVQSLVSSKLIIRLVINTPALEITINGRFNPPRVSYEHTTLNADLEIGASADTLHEILLGTLPLSQAWQGGKLTTKGSILKSFVLVDIFHAGQNYYPKVLEEAGIKQL